MKANTAGPEFQVSAFSPQSFGDQIWNSHKDVEFL